MDGGLKMLHLPSTISGLKIAWVKRLLDESSVGQWKCFYEHCLSPFGGNFFWYSNIDKDCASVLSIKNIFIREVAQSWASLTLDMEINPSHCRRQNIWNNNIIRNNHRTLFIKSWYDKGIVTLSDLLDENGNIFTFFEFKNKYKFECDFADFYSMKTAIPITEKKIPKCTEVNPTAPETMNKNIMEVTRVCRYVHNLSVQRIFNPPKSIDKWNSLLNTPNLDWPKIYLVPIRASLSTRIRYFQFKLIHRILEVNKYLKTINISISDLCSLCYKSEETIEHLFWDCPITRRFIADVQHLILDDKVTLSKINFLFGFYGSVGVQFNFIILYAKYYIFSSKCKNSTLSLNSFKCMLKHYRTVEQYMYLKNNKFVSFDSRWKNIILL